MHYRYAIRHVKSGRFLTRRADHYIGLASDKADLELEAAKAEAAAVAAAAGEDGLLGTRAVARLGLGAGGRADGSSPGPVPVATVPVSDDGEILMVKLHALEERSTYDVTFWEQRLGLRVTKTLPLTVIGFTEPKPGRPAYEAEALGTVMVGDTVTHIDGRSIVGLSRQEVFQLLNNLKRPVVMSMCSWRAKRAAVSLYLSVSLSVYPHSTSRILLCLLRCVLGRVTLPERCDG